MVTQQEKKMLWEYFGKGSGVEIQEVKGAQTRIVLTDLGGCKRGCLVRSRVNTSNGSASIKIGENHDVYPGNIGGD